jgi:hypothetical protein
MQSALQDIESIVVICQEEKERTSGVEELEKGIGEITVK